MEINQIILIYYFLGVNLFTYLIYMIDKKKAVNNQYRISEQFLLVLVIGGGTIGSLLSMIINRHKIKKFAFIVKYILANILFLYLLFENYQKISMYINHSLS